MLRALLRMNGMACNLGQAINMNHINNANSINSKPKPKPISTCKPYQAHHHPIEYGDRPRGRLQHGARALCQSTCQKKEVAVAAGRVHSA